MVNSQVHLWIFTLLPPSLEQGGRGPGLGFFPFSGGWGSDQSIVNRLGPSTVVSLKGRPSWPECTDTFTYPEVPFVLPLWDTAGDFSDFFLRESVLTRAGKFSSRVRVLVWVLLPHQASRKPRFSYLAAGSQRVFCLGRLWFSPALEAAVLGLLLKNVEKVADFSFFFSVLRSPALSLHTCVIRTGWWFPSFLHARLETKVFDCYPVFKNMWHFGKIFSSFNLSCHNYEADWETFAWNFMFVCLF